MHEDEVEVQPFDLTLSHHQNLNLNFNNNGNNNGNRGRWRKQSLSSDLRINGRRGFRRARKRSGASNRKTGSGREGDGGALQRRRPLPVKVRGELP